MTAAYDDDAQAALTIMAMVAEGSDQLGDYIDLLTPEDQNAIFLNLAGLGQLFVGLLLNATGDDRSVGDYLRALARTNVGENP